MAITRKLDDYNVAVRRGASLGNIEIDDLDQINDSNGNEILEFDQVASAVNHIGVVNAATGNNPQIQAKGESDTGITFATDDDEEILILNGTAGAVNEVTITSAAANAAPSIAATGGDTNIDLTLTAKGTGGILYRDKTETVAATNSINASESGSVFFLNHSTEFASTLPAEAAGLHFTFIVTAAPSGASYTIVPDAGTTIHGHSVSSADAGGSADSTAGTGVGTITFVDGQAAVGDMVQIWCDGTNWFALATMGDEDAITFS